MDHLQSPMCIKIHVSKLGQKKILLFFNDPAFFYHAKSCEEDGNKPPCSQVDDQSRLQDSFFRNKNLLPQFLSMWLRIIIYAMEYVRRTNQ